MSCIYRAATRVAARFLFSCYHARMTSFFTALVHLDPVAMLQTGSYAGLALLVFAESGLLVGIFFPGDSLLFAAGLLSVHGFIAIGPTIATVIISAIVGDSVGYWLGDKAGDALFARENSRFFKKEYLARTETFFATYGGRAIVLARFVPIVRTLAPTLAGAGSMKYRAFLTYNIIGGTLWGAGVTAVGYFLGSIIPNSETYIFPISLAIIVISFLPIAIKLIITERAT